MANKCPECDTDNPSDSNYCKKCATPLPSSEEIPVSPTKTLEVPMKELEIGGTFSRKYKILDEIGKGGMGVVYKALDSEIKEDVAIKILKPEIAQDKSIIERFRNELKIARKISHKNVCRMYDLNKEEGTYYITMEYVPGEDLKDVIRRDETISTDKAISITKQVCEGLVEAHRIGVVHRDLKPQNIMIDAEGEAKVMDFGIARSVEAPGVTATGMIIGTPDYISPEQAEGEETDQRSDIYALGVILYEMVTGRVPFKGDTALSVALKHKTKIPLDPRKLNPRLSEDLSRLTLVCMEKDKERRYQTAEALLADLRNIEDGLPLGTKMRPRRETFVATLIRKKLLIPALVVALAIIAVLIWQLLPQRGVVSPVPSDRPSIAIMYFKNNTGEESLDHWRSGLSDLLTSDLAQSKYIYVLPEDRLFRILKQLNLLEARIYATEDLEKVAARGRVENILLGSYSKAGDNFRVDVSIKKVRSGEEIRIEAVGGRGEESYFAMVDELTMRIKENLDLSEEEIASDFDRKAGEITTNSPEAYRYFREGAKYSRMGNHRKAIQLWNDAVALDPEFALCYSFIGFAYTNLGEYDEARKYLQKAWELRDRVSESERLGLQAILVKTLDERIEIYKELLDLNPYGQDDLLLGLDYGNSEEWDKAIEWTEKGRQSWPDSFGAYWNLAWLNRSQGMYDKAREILDHFLNNYSENAQLFTLSAVIELCLGKYDLALSELEKAFALDPTHFPAVKVKVDTYLCKGDTVEAERICHELLEMDSGDAKFFGRDRLGCLYLMEGKLEEARDQWQKAIELDAVRSHLSLAYLYLKTDKLKESLGELERGLKLAPLYREGPWFTHWDIYGIWRRNYLYLKGLVHVSLKPLDKAQETADELKSFIEKGLNQKAMRYYYSLQGMIEIENEDFSQAIAHLEKSTSLLFYQQGEDDFDYHALFIEPLALAYYKSGDMENALREYEKITSLTTGRIHFGDIYAKSFYMLGKIYEQKDWKGKAIEHYEKFLDLWKDADPGIAEVEDARKRVAALKDQ